ncbi:MAG: LysE family transporter [Candidatus Cardinium sp.]
MQNFYIDDFIMLYTANLFNILSPGANVTITICNSNTISRKAGMMTGMGIICSSSIRKGCTICGIGLIISKAFWLFQLVKYVGSAYLFYLGVQYFWRSIATQAENKNLHTILLNNSLGKSSMNHIQAFQVGFLTDVVVRI